MNKSKVRGLKWHLKKLRGWVLHFNLIFFNSIIITWILMILVLLRQRLDDHMVWCHVLKKVEIFGHKKENYG